MKPEEIRVCVLLIEGTNCEDETFDVFRTLGTKPERVHLKQLSDSGVPKDKRRSLEDFHVLVIPGGFSSGDYVRAGAIFAARMRAILARDIVNFVDEGKPIIGICNGFQVLVEMGLLPAFGSIMSETPQVALGTNDSARYECRPTLLKHENGGRCKLTKGIPRGRVLLAPSAHAEGKFLFPKAKERAFLSRLLDNDQVIFRYVDPDGNYAGYPWNPNGSIYNIAGICNETGNVLGMMPHPERSFYRFLHPDWTRSPGDLYGDGKMIFDSILDYVRGRF